MAGTRQTLSDYVEHADGGWTIARFTKTSLVQ